MVGSPAVDGSGSDGLFAGVFARGGAAGEVDDRAWLQGMLDFEAALARARRGPGRDPAGGSRRRSPRPAAPSASTSRELGRDAAAAGQPGRPAGPRAPAGCRGRRRRYVHQGATSQDVDRHRGDARRPPRAGPILDDLAGAADAAPALADAHRGHADRRPDAAAAGAADHVRAQGGRLAGRRSTRRAGARRRARPGAGGPARRRGRHARRARRPTGRRGRPSSPHELGLGRARPALAHRPRRGRRAGRRARRRRRRARQDRRAT